MYYIYFTLTFTLIHTKFSFKIVFASVMLIHCFNCFPIVSCELQKMMKLNTESHYSYFIMVLSVIMQAKGDELEVRKSLFLAHKPYISVCGSVQSLSCF